MESSKMVSLLSLMIYQNFRISSKIMLESSIALGLFVCVSVLTYFGIIAAEKNVDQYQRYVIQSNRIGRVEENLLNAKLFTANFLKTHNIKSATKDTIGSIQGVSEVIRSISTNSTIISTAVEQQNSATQEISNNIQEATAGTQYVSTNIVKVREETGQTEISSGEVLEAASELSIQSEALRTQVDNFLLGLRASYGEI